MIILNPTVGVAPGTTTMQLGIAPMVLGPGPCGPNGCPPLGAPCPPDEPWMYTSPPVVSSETATVTFGPPPPPDKKTGPTALDPYGTESKLRGLGGTTPRWGLVMFAGLATFAAVLGVGYWRRRR